MNKNNNSFFKVWEIAYPFCLYYVVNLLSIWSAGLFLGSDNEHYMMCQIISAIITLPIMFFGFYKADKTVIKRDRQPAGLLAYNGAAVIVISFILGVSLNNILGMTPLVSVSAGYQEANANFYSSTLAIELLGSGFLVPIMEELVFRGIIFHRLKVITGKKYLSVFLASLIFAIMHFNIVQFIFAFLLGSVLALFMDKVGNVWAAILGHMTINSFGVLRTELGLLPNTIDGSLFAWVISIIGMIIGLVLLFIYIKREQ